MIQAGGGSRIEQYIKIVEREMRVAQDRIWERLFVGKFPAAKTENLTVDVLARVAKQFGFDRSAKRMIDRLELSESLQNRLLMSLGIQHPDEASGGEIHAAFGTVKLTVKDWMPKDMVVALDRTGQIVQIFHVTDPEVQE